VSEEMVIPPRYESREDSDGWRVWDRGEKRYASGTHDKPFIDALVRQRNYIDKEASSV